MKLLIAGAGSPAGRELIELMKRKDILHQAIPDRFLNALDKEALGHLLTRYNPDQLINVHAYKSNSQSAVLKAEGSADRCHTIQYQHTRLLTDLCAQKEIPLVHLSTSYVFNGEKKLGYSEQDEVDPIGVYGKTAVMGEQVVAELPKYVILRNGWMFGYLQCDLIRSWIKNCKKDAGAMSALRRRFSPTANEDLARIILAVCQQIDCDANVWGTYHYCGLETKKESEFVQQVLKYASQFDEEIYQLIDTIKISEVHADSPEVANTTLSSKKIFDTFGIKQHSWHGYLKNTIKSICQETHNAEVIAPTGKGVSIPENFSSKSLH